MIVSNKQQKLDHDQNSNLPTGKQEIAFAIYFACLLQYSQRQK